MLFRGTVIPPSHGGEKDRARGRFQINHSFGKGGENV
jgi:hypothetical protein